MNLKYLDQWTIDEFNRLHKNSYLSSKQLSYKILNNGIVLPPPVNLSKYSHATRGLGGVSTSNGIFIDDTHLQSGDGGVYKYDNCQYEDCLAIYVGFFYGVWGHMITDNLKFLWFLYTDKYKELKKQYKTIKLVYISPSEFKAEKRFKELLSLADIDYSLFERVQEVTKYKNLLVPETCFFLDGFYRYYTLEYKNIIDRIMSKIQVKNVDKVYLTRVKLHDKRDFGEKDIESAFKKNGYKIISPEKISLIEQLTIYKNAREIAVTEGSISHNAIFMSEGATLVLLKKTNLFNTYQETVNDLKHLNVIYIDAHLSCFVDIKAQWLGPFFLYCNDHISDFLDCKRKFNIFKYLVYIFKCFRLRNLENRMLSNAGLYKKLGYEFSMYMSPKQKLSSILKRIKL